MTINRRQFVRNSSLALGAALLARKGSLAASLDARIDIVLREELGTISPNIYGHFTENLGGVIYDGVWVGENSKIANVGGIRKSLVDALQKINSPVIRWPGGCFADSYDWKDGIGPVGQAPAPHQLLGRRSRSSAIKATPRRNTTPTNSAPTSSSNSANLPAASRISPPTSAACPPEDFYRWVEYCNSPAGSTTLADFARCERLPRRVQRPLLGHRQRILGLWWRNDRG